MARPGKDERTPDAHNIWTTGGVQEMKLGALNDVRKVVSCTMQCSELAGHCSHKSNNMPVDIQCNQHQENAQIKPE